MKNKILLSGIALLALLVSISAVSAFGVSAPYWGENPLSMAPGEVKVVNFNLQNAGGGGDVSVKVILTQGFDIASLGKDTYTVKAGTIDTMVPLKIMLPDDATGVYKVALEFKTITSGAGGGVAMGVGMTAGFDVIVTEKVVPAPPAKVPMSTYFSVLLLMLIIIVIAAVALKKKKRAR